MRSGKEVVVMTERLRELLDAAVAEVRPRRSDPVSDIVRRSRAGRRRVAVAGALMSVLLVVGGGVAVGGVLRGAGGGPGGPAASSGPTRSTPKPTSAAPTAGAPFRPVAPTPATPRVVGGKVRSGGLTLPVPAGWRVQGLPATDDCLPARTITLGWRPVHDGRCVHDRVISVWGVAGGQSIPGIPTPVTSQLLLPGGQPAWLGMGAHGSPDPLGKRPGLRTVEMYVPWSGTWLELNVGYDDLTRILATVRTEPAAPSRLVLHPDALGGGYFVPASDQPTVDAWSTRRREPATQVLERLRALTDVVLPGQECGKAGEPAVAIHLFPSDGAMTGNDTVVITESDGCYQATSANGGRVRVPPGLAEQLRPFFTVPAAQASGTGGTR